MSVLGEILDELGETIIPEVAAIVFPDTCFISRATETKDTGGALKATWVNVNGTAIPCVYEPKSSNFKNEIGGKIIALADYAVTLPSNQSQTLVDIRTDDRIVVIARGNQLAKTFKILGIKNDSGVVLEAACKLEN